MLIHSYCCECKRRFFADIVEDVVKGNFYCSFCMPFIRECVICSLPYKINSEKREAGICQTCRKEYGLVNNYIPGWLTKWNILRFHTFKKDNFTCRYCGRSPIKDLKVVLHCDHLIPKSKGGTDDNDNLVTSCKDCNSGKADVMLEQNEINKIKLREVLNERSS